MFLAFGVGAGDENRFQSLFDGQTLAEWEGSAELWRVRDRTIVGGTLQAPMPDDEFLCTRQGFGDFELRLEARMSGGQAGGVSFRAQRVPDSTRVGGYQADMGFIPGKFMPIVSDLTDVDPDEPYPLWGSLLDEYRPETSRYPNPNAPYRLIAVAARAVIDDVLRPGDWNDVTVLAMGDHVEIGLNGTKTVEHTERGDVPRVGFICLQVHSGPPSEAYYRNIRIRQR